MPLYDPLPPSEARVLHPRDWSFSADHRSGARHRWRAISGGFDHAAHDRDLRAVLLRVCATAFDDLRTDSPTVALPRRPTIIPCGFGSVVTGYGGTARGVFGSRNRVSAGADPPFTVYPLLIGDEMRPETPTSTAATTAFPAIRARGLARRDRCGARARCASRSPRPRPATVRIRCEDDASMNESFMGPSGERFGVVGAGVPIDHPFGRAIFGAPGALGGRGTVYIAREGRPAAELDLSEGFGGGSEIGSTVALAVIDADSMMVATSAPVGPMKRVIASTTDVLTDGTVVTHVNDCLDETSDGWGGALAIGDLNGDGAPEARRGERSRWPPPQRARLDGASMPPDGRATDRGRDRRRCPAIEGVVQRGRALRRVDRDRRSRRRRHRRSLVGARTRTSATSAAPRVFSSAAPRRRALDDDAVALRHSSPTRAPRSALRAVAPGSSRRRDRTAPPGRDRRQASIVHMFLCSGLGGDSPESAGRSCHQ
jgi:hypothetical protein